MNLKNICFGALAFSMVSGAALAGGVMDSPDAMSPFFTDSSMKTMKPMEEFKKVFMAMPMEKQEAMKAECNDAVMSKAHPDFCANVHVIYGN